MLLKPIRRCIRMHKFLAVLAVLLLPTASAQYNYDDYDFTEVLTDLPDLVGFYDFVSWSIAETGDGNLIFLIEQADNSGGNAGDQMIVRFVSNTQKAMGFNSAFEPSAQQAGDGTTPESCEATSSTEVYCIVTYASAGVTVGSTISMTQAATYSLAIMDQAPELWAILGLPGIVTGDPAPSGDDYILVGCTMKDQSACPVEELPPEREFFQEDLGNGSISIDFDAAEPAFAEYIYNFSLEETPATFTYDVKPTNGTVTFTLRDQFDELVVATVETNFTDILEVDGFPGPWSLTASYTDFVGSASFSVSEPIPEFIPIGPGSNETEAPVNETTEPEEESTPGFAVPAMIVGLAIVALRRRA